MLKLACVALLVFGLGPLGAASLGATAAADAPETVDLTVRQTEAKEALPVLRSIAGARGLQVIDEHTIRMTDSAEAVRLAREALDIAEHPSDLAKEVPAHEVADGSVIVCVHVQHASVKDILVALRKRLAIAKIAINEDLSTVMVRDTPAQVKAAIEIIRNLE